METKKKHSNAIKIIWFSKRRIVLSNWLSGRQDIIRKMLYIGEKNLYINITISVNNTKQLIALGNLHSAGITCLEDDFGSEI